jgi:membrane protein implicated in regulation of membrane protease activity
MKKVASILLLAVAILLSAGGIAGFALLFVRDMNVYWLILSPIIFAMYQIPAVFVIWLWKKKRQKSSQENPRQNG